MKNLFMPIVLCALAFGSIPASAGMSSANQQSVRTAFYVGAGVCGSLAVLSGKLVYDRAAAPVSKINKEINEQAATGNFAQLTYSPGRKLGPNEQQFDTRIIQAVRNYNFAITRPIDAADYASRIEINRTICAML